MKTKSLRLISLLLLACAIISLVVSCGPTKPEEPAVIDYAASTSFSPTATDTAKQEVTVIRHIDGDTTHFSVPTSVVETGVLKARYLGINTPESTGQIQPWGKKAAAFTREKLESADSIYIESDDLKWNPDSTGGRYLVWVWYRPEGTDTYRNLNLEIMQNGLAIMSNSAENRYGDACLAAYNQAKEQKLHVHSDANDPDFFYGSAIELTLRELRANISEYVGARVAFEGVVTKNSGANGVYVEAYDEETAMYNGIYIYLGANATPQTTDVFTLGNRVRVVGKVSEFSGSYQISDVSGAGRRPTANDSQVLDSETHEPSFTETDIDVFRRGTVTFESEDEIITKSYAEMALGTSISFKNITVVRTYTTTNPASSSQGAFTLYCEDENGEEIAIRTIVLRDSNGNTLLASDYYGKVIDVYGVVDFYDPNSSDDDAGETGGFYYQIKVVATADLVIVS